MKDNPSDGNRKSVECSQWLSVVTGGHSRQPIRWTGFHAKSYYSAGHDGYIVEYCKCPIGIKGKIKNQSPGAIEEQSLSIKCIHKAAPITAVESIWWDDGGKSLIVVGTRALDLIIYNMTKKCELLRLEIGGWRRPFDVLPIYHDVDIDESKSDNSKIEARKIELFSHKKFVTLLLLLFHLHAQTHAGKGRLQKPDNKKLFVLLIFKEAPIITPILPWNLHFMAEYRPQ